MNLVGWVQVHSFHHAKKTVVIQKHNVWDQLVFVGVLMKMVKKFLELEQEENQIVIAVRQLILQSLV